jgi:hypothetical protein
MRFLGGLLMNNADSSSVLYCSFCGKSQHEVVKLIAGPSVFVCDECVDVCVDIIYDDDGNARIRRTITFEPEYAQAGISILANFSRIIGQKYPGIPVEVTIEQSGSTVSMLVVTPTGEQERVLETMDDYGAMLRGEMRPDQFLTNPVHVMELNNKLQLTALELKMTQDMLEFARIQTADRIVSLENQVSMLQSLVGKSLSCASSPASVLEALSSYRAADEELKSAVATLVKAHSRKTPANDPSVQLALEIVRRKDSSLYSDIKDVTKDLIASVAASVTTGALAAVVAVVPK